MFCFRSAVFSVWVAGWVEFVSRVVWVDLGWEVAGFVWVGGCCFSASRFLLPVPFCLGVGRQSGATAYRGSDFRASQGASSLVV